MSSPKGRTFPQTAKLWRHHPIGNRFPVYEDVVMAEFINLRGMNITINIADSIALSEVISATEA